MLSVREAIGRLLARARVLAPVETAPVAELCGRVLAEELVADLDVPPAANSAMDGYALRSRDWPGASAALPVRQRIAAGQAPQPLEPGSAARIFTGAEIPPGADTVVMQEECEAGEGEVVIRQRPAAGANIRPRGQDLAAGQRVLAAGRRLRPQDVGLLASLGRAEAAVHARLRVALVCNGDELIEPGAAAGPGQIYNSNRYLLRCLLNDWGFRVVDLGIVPDQPALLAEALERAAGEADVIVSAGGVSVGEEDHVKDVVAALGRLDLWKVAIKPGKPLAFGEVRDTPFIGLPGNPASVWVTSLVIARPFLYACQGRREAEAVPLPRPARFARRGGSREEYLRARLTAEGVELFPNQSSGVLLSASWGDGLAVQRPGQDIAAGDAVDFLPYAQLR